VAVGHSEKGRVADAGALLADCEPPKPGFEPQLFFMLARACQRAQDHEQALGLFRMLSQASPGLSAQKEFRKAVRQSEKAVGAETSLVPSDPIYRSKAFKWTAAAIVLVLAIAGSNLFIQTHRTLHVVNGLKAPLVVQIDDGTPVDVAAHGRTTLSLAEGAHRAVVTQPPGFTEPVEFSLHARWVDRFFKKPV